MTSAKTKFCQSFKWRCTIKWFDLTGFVCATGGPRVAKIELVKNGQCDTYVGFRVSIILHSEGVIDDKLFIFDDYLTSDTTPTSDDGIQFFTGSKTNWTWSQTPESTDNLVEAIASYLDIFRVFRIS